MPSQGPLYPSAAATSSANGGTADWATPADALAEDDQRAECNGGAGGATSYYLLVTGFGFSIPAGATIEGIQADVLKRRVGAQAVDSRVRLVKGGAVQDAADRAEPGTNWPVSDGYASHGGPADLWANTWTAADVNAAGFGVALAADVSPTSIAEVNAVRVSVVYAGGAVETRTVPVRAEAPWHPAFTEE